LDEFLGAREDSRQRTPGNSGKELLLHDNQSHPPRGRKPWETRDLLEKRNLCLLKISGDPLPWRRNKGSKGLLQNHPVLWRSRTPPPTRGESVCKGKSLVFNLEFEEPENLKNFSGSTILLQEIQSRKHPSKENILDLCKHLVLDKKNSGQKTPNEGTKTHSGLTSPRQKN